MPEAPNYTSAALVMGLVNLLWIFGVIWAVFGLPVVVAVGIVLNRVITWLAHRRG
ncbi:hypothetical protein [Roseovarius sp. E0-M6]|uniref:hypothetical protein n=1 Tax=Roseovarius sp. E0-M6 TaxID=3127118 RepID=UPI00300FE38B